MDNRCDLYLSFHHYHMYHANNLCNSFLTIFIIINFIITASCCYHFRLRHNPCLERRSHSRIWHTSQSTGPGWQYILLFSQRRQIKKQLGIETYVLYVYFWKKYEIFTSSLIPYSYKTVISVLFAHAKQDSTLITWIITATHKGHTLTYQQRPLHYYALR